MLRRLRAQIMAEYAVIVSVMVLALVTMLPLVKRSTQKITKLAADQIGDQVDADQDFNAESGYLLNTSTIVSASSQTDQYYIPGATGKIFNDIMSTKTSTYTDQGFSEEYQDVVVMGTTMNYLNMYYTNTLGP